MENLLLELRRHGAQGLKIELESEVFSIADAARFKALADGAGLDLTVKIGGCGCVNDIYFAQHIGAKALVAPMIESSYALEKFYKTAREIGDFELWFNIETAKGLENLDSMLKCEFIDDFKGIVFGRSDFCASLGGKVAPEDTIETVLEVAKKAQDADLELIVGGNITAKSIDYLKEVWAKFETRIVVFEREALENDLEKTLELALEFEILWLKSKVNKTALDEKRIGEIERRLRVSGVSAKF